MTILVDDGDVAQLSGTLDFGGNPGHVWSNRPRQGQSFSTGANAGGYLMNAFTLRVQVNQGSTTAPMWEVRVGSVDGSDSMAVLRTETNAGVTLPNSTAGNSFPNWVTWTLDTPLLLSPNAEYGFDVFANGGGFISLHSDTGDMIAGGAAYSSGSAGVLGAAGSTAYPIDPLTMHNTDRVFHVDLQAIPESSTSSLLFVGMAVLGLARRQRRA